MVASKLKAVSADRPCAVCSGNHKRSRTRDGLMLCGRSDGAVAGFRHLGAADDPTWHLDRAEEDDPIRGTSAAHAGRLAKAFEPAPGQTPLQGRTRPEPNAIGVALSREASHRALRAEVVACDTGLSGVDFFSVHG